MAVGAAGVGEEKGGGVEGAAERVVGRAEVTGAEVGDVDVVRVQREEEGAEGVGEERELAVDGLIDCVHTIKGFSSYSLKRPRQCLSPFCRARSEPDMSHFVLVDGHVNVQILLRQLAAHALGPLDET